jgi:hypothetical protein
MLIIYRENTVINKDATLEETITPVASFDLEHPFSLGYPNPENISRIKVFLHGLAGKSMTIVEFLKSAKNNWDALSSDTNAILGAVAALMRKMNFKGNAMEFIFTYFGFHDPSEKLDVIVRQGVPSSGVSAPATFNQEKIEKASKPVYNPVFRKEISRVQTYQKFKELQALGIQNPVPGKTYPEETPVDLHRDLPNPHSFKHGPYEFPIGVPNRVSNKIFVAGK